MNDRTRKTNANSPNRISSATENYIYVALRGAGFEYDGSDVRGGGASPWAKRAMELRELGLTAKQAAAILGRERVLLCHLDGAVHSMREFRYYVHEAFVQVGIPLGQITGVALNEYEGDVPDVVLRVWEKIKDCGVDLAIAETRYRALLEMLAPAVTHGLLTREAFHAMETREDLATMPDEAQADDVAAARYIAGAALYAAFAGVVPMMRAFDLQIPPLSTWPGKSGDYPAARNAVEGWWNRLCDLRHRHWIRFGEDPFVFEQKNPYFKDGFADEKCHVQAA